MSLPAEVTFGTVVGSFFAAIADGSDVGADPDSLALTGQVTFTPSVVDGRLKAMTSTPPATINQQPVPVQLVAGAFSVNLIATDNAAVDPVGWVWTVDFNLHTSGPGETLAATRVTVEPFSFSLPAGTTQDLTLVAPAVPVAGGTYYLNEALAAAAAAAASAASAAASAALVGAPADTAVAAIFGNAASASRVVADAVYARTLVAADSLRMWGHSYPAGTGVGVTAGVDDFSTILAEMLGLPLRNEAIGGAGLYNSISAASNWTNILQKVTRPARFTPPTGLILSMYGMNDLNLLGNTLAAMQPFLVAQRAAISRLRQGRIFENTDTSVVLAGSGTWTPNFISTANSGVGVAYNVTDGGTIRISTPPDFPGGTIALGFVAWGDGGGATISGTVNGTVYSIDTAATSRTDCKTCSVLRIPNVPAGSAAYTFTTSATSGSIGTMFDYWAWEPDAADGPLIVLVKQPHPLDLTGYGSTPPGPPTNAGIDIMNTAFDTLAAEFGVRVITVDTSAIDGDATCFVSGNVHPTVKGHRRLAEIIRNRIAGLVAPRQAASVSAPRIEYGTAAPTGADRNYHVGDTMVNTAPTLGGAPGWVCTTAGAPGTWQAQSLLGVTGTGPPVTSGTVAPTTGPHVVGELCYNSAPATGQPIGWECTVAGTPGTWVAMSLLGAGPAVTWAAAAPTTGAHVVAEQVWKTAPARGSAPGWICTTAGTPGTWSEMEPLRVGGGVVTLVAGTVTVTGASILASTTQIRVWALALAGTPGALYISAKVSGTSFTISSTSATDTSTVQYEILTY